MTNETNNVPNNGQSAADQDEKLHELVKAVHHNGTVSLKTRFDNVEGQVMMHDVYGPVFVYRVKDEAGDDYVVGFFLRELVTKFQAGGDVGEWMASFYFELMNTKGGRLLPRPPQNDEEAKAVIDKVIVPSCIAAVKEEFETDEQKVHVGLDWNKEHGPVLEAGFPAIKDGNNVCAFPLHVLMAHLLLNREPSELVTQAMYKILEEHDLG